MKKIAKILIIIIVFNILFINLTYAISPELKGFGAGILPFLILRNSYNKKVTRNVVSVVLSSWKSSALAVMLCGVIGLAVISTAENDERNRVFKGWALGGFTGYITVIEFQW